MTTANVDNESEDDGAAYSDRNLFLFPISMNQFLRNRQRKRRRVVDTSSILKLIEEMQDSLYFKHILKANYITPNTGCHKHNEEYKRKFFKEKYGEIPQESTDSEEKCCRVVRSDYEILEERILNSSVDIRKRLCM